MKKLILLVMFVLCVSLVSAEPPFIDEGTFAQGLTIEFPQFQYLEQGVDYEVSLHVFNTTNGVEMTNTTTDCHVHLYNDTGHKLIQDQLLSFDNVSKDFYGTISGTNFSYLGFYVILGNCNTATQGGFTNHLVEATIMGDPLPTTTNGSFLITGLIFIFLTSLAAFGLYHSKKVWVKTVLTLGLTLLIMTLMRLSMFFVELADPAHTGIFDVLTVFYMFAIWAFRFALIAGIFILLIIITNTMLHPKKFKKDDWEKWGKE